jgi:Uncharacterised nucleotidyltransferase
MTPAQVFLETLRLRHTLDSDVLQREWSRTETQGLARLIMHEGCGLWLYRRFKDLHIDAADAPWKPFHAWLSRQARRTTAQNRVVADFVASVLPFFATEGAPCVLIKGAARVLAAPTYPFADAREANGVDVLASPEDAQRVWRAMRAAGFEVAAEARQSPTALPALVNEMDVPVEIHTASSVFEDPKRSWERTLACAAHVSSGAGGGGTHAMVPSATDLLWQAMSHVFRHGEYAFRIRFWQDAACIQASGRVVDWGEIQQRLATLRGEQRAAVLSWLGATAWLAGAPLSTDISSGVPPFNISRIAHWRLAVCRRLDPASHAGHHLIRQATLAEVPGALPHTPELATGKRIGETAGAVFGRGTYFGWRVASDRRRLTGGSVRAPHATRETQT